MQATSSSFRAHYVIADRAYVPSTSFVFRIHEVLFEYRMEGVGDSTSKSV